MNREIKFRGKEKDSGAWVYGFYVKHQTHTLAPLRTEEEKPEYQHLILKSGFSDWNMAKPLDIHEVSEASVGQATGLKDKNGREIFEGDILAINKISEVVYEVRFGNYEPYGSNERQQGFYMHDNNNASSIPLLQNYTVIGNIYENPELLGGGA